MHKMSCVVCTQPEFFFFKLESLRLFLLFILSVGSYMMLVNKKCFCRTWSLWVCFKMTGLGVDMESLSVRVIKHSQKNLNIKNGNERFPCKAKFYYIRHKNCDLITKIDNMK